MKEMHFLSFGSFRFDTQRRKLWRWKLSGAKQ
jgi:hypothetical protein